MSDTGVVQVTSNKVTCSRSDVSFITPLPYDALYDKDSHQVYVYSASGNITVYDAVSKKNVKTVSIGGITGYCDLGIYNGVKELYVPRSDNWVFIYNASTLEQIDQIKVDSQTASVAYNNGILICTSSYYDSAIASNSSKITTYSRSTKNKISQTTGEYSVLIKKIPGTNTDFFGVRNYGGLYYYSFSAAGIFNSQQSNLGGGGLLPLEVFPDGSHFITSLSGVIYDKQLNFTKKLVDYEYAGELYFTSFDFDNTNQLIYAGCSTNAIRVYSMGNYQLTKTINTKGYPIKVFYDNGSVICVSAILPMDQPDFYPSYAFIEQY